MKKIRIKRPNKHKVIFPKLKLLERTENDWTSIHPDFGMRAYFSQGTWWTYQNLWESRGLSYKQTKQWIKAGLGLENDDVPHKWSEKGFTDQQAQSWLKVGLNKEGMDFAEYLLNKGYNFDTFFDGNQLMELKKQYLEEANDWSVVHPEFVQDIYQGFTHQDEWEKEGFTYHNAQEWIDAGFKPIHLQQIQKWKSLGFVAQKAKEWKEAGLEEYESDLAIYFQTREYPPWSIKDNLSKYKDEYKSWNRTPKPSQKEFDSIYPHHIRSEIQEINIDRKNLQGSLIIRDFIRVEEISCSSNQITEIIIVNCPQLNSLHCSENKLISLEFLTNLNPETLTYLSIRENNLSFQNLSIFAKLKLRNLEELDLSMNNLFGSLEHLKNAKKLRKLSINKTQIDSGLEYLPKSLEKLYCSGTKLEEELNPYNGSVKAWKLDQEKKALESDLNLTEQRIAVLQSLINEQKAKVVQAYQAFAPEKELLQELITIHLEYCKAKNQKRDDTIKLRKQRDKLRDELEERLEKQLGGQYALEVQNMLTDCEGLIHWMTELDEQLSKRQKLLEEQKQFLQITDKNNESKIIELETKLQENKEQVKILENQLTIFAHKPQYQSKYSIVNNKGNIGSIGDYSEGKIYQIEPEEEESYYDTKESFSSSVSENEDWQIQIEEKIETVIEQLNIK